MINVQDLTISFPHQAAAAVRGVSLSVAAGEIVGLVGESGSGKSLTSLAIAGLLPDSARATGQVLVERDNSDVVDMVSTTEETAMLVRARDVSVVFQEPMTSLNPVLRVGEQVAEAVAMSNRGVEDVSQFVTSLFRDVHLPNPESIGSKYPHQLSGGQKQRVMIAMALASKPRLLIADEPTTALDVTVQKSILRILRELVHTHNLAVLFVSHDLGVIAELCDRVYVMKQGEIVESGTTRDVLLQPQHVYTQGLLACRPSLSNTVHRLPTLETHGQIPEYFSPSENSSKRPQKSEPVLSVENIVVSYQKQGGLLWKKQYVPAVKGVSLQVHAGEIHGVVGESGCGKTTVGKAIVGLLPYSSGEILVHGTDVRTLLAEDPVAYRKKVQLIFQDPYGSLNPRLTIGEALYEVARVHKIPNDKRDKVIGDILEVTGMPFSCLSKYPFQFSGGQRQRICIARSLIVEPELLICDESVSALDVSVQAQVLNVLKDLRDAFGVSMLFVTHDLSVVRFMCDSVTVMNNGCVEECGRTDDVLDRPQQAYTQKLIEAIPRIEAQ